MIPYPKGTQLYIPSAQWSSIPSKCPVCKATGKISTKAFGDDDKDAHIHECEYCRWATRDGLPFGHVVDQWKWQPHVQTITVEGTEVSDRNGKLEIKYLWNITSASWNSTNHENVFADKQLAMAKAEEMASTAVSREMPTVNKSHSIGYARSQVKRLKEEIVRWERMFGKKSS